MTERKPAAQPKMAVLLRDAVFKLVVNEEIEELAKRALLSDKPLSEMVQEGLMEGLRQLQVLYQYRGIATPQLFVGMMAVEKAFSVFRASARSSELPYNGTVVLGTVGTPHEAGRKLVNIALTLAGFEVHDIEGNKIPSDFVNRAEKVRAHIIASSCMILAARPMQKEIETLLREKGLKGKIKTIIGGQATSPEWAKEIGADAYGVTMLEAATEAERLMEELGGVQHG